ncbi:hypothetical protein CONLIGDRAFT_635015 [Coniochaeta ligniaria NRRL 30616]|uniref:DUF155 domain-containing protein n=1 Tax=Coniochaeta ligniaria NRRL 30616 TaxID=1408157 RepID=A0A1J7JGM9_9PEZI|nr:hypothetical protein CONLIGDRAFT_635015 [Coniochaeta ligniaria NRRL 30616]
MMRQPQQKALASMRRTFHLAHYRQPSAGSRPLLARRRFHLTAPTYLPRKRSFFTSNVFLQQNGTEPSVATPGVGRTPDFSADNGRAKTDKTSSSSATSYQPTSQPAATLRRKPPLKNSLRRVAVVAQKGVPSKTAATAAADVAVDAADGSATISAVCVADSFDMDAVVDALLVHGFLLDPDDSGFEVHEVVHARGANNGDIFVFPSGTVVTWSLPPDVVTALATRHLLPAAEDPHLDRKEVEDLEYVVDATRESSTMTGDVVVLGTKAEADDGDRLNTTLAKIAFSSGLARSTKLAVLESSLNSYFESTRQIPGLLSRGSRFTLSRRFILQKTGELLNLRAQLNHYNELTDSLPDIFWDSKSELRLETYYDRVGKALDVGVRIKTLNEKMNYAQEVVNVLRETSSEKHSTRLEWIIIVLIAVEVFFELRRVYMEKHDRDSDDAAKST